MHLIHLDNRTTLNVHFLLLSCIACAAFHVGSAFEPHTAKHLALSNCSRAIQLCMATFNLKHRRNLRLLVVQNQARVDS